jgi:hypothetical protein
VGSCAVFLVVFFGDALRCNCDGSTIVNYSKADIQKSLFYSRSRHGADIALLSIVRLYEQELGEALASARLGLHVQRRVRWTLGGVPRDGSYETAGGGRRGRSGYCRRQKTQMAEQVHDVCENRAAVQFGFCQIELISVDLLD